MRIDRAAYLALSLVVSFASAASAIEVTGCGQEVPAGQVGVLTADLDCGSSATAGSYGVELEANATLDLQGHTITGSQWAIYCSERGTCHVTSTTDTGTVTGAEAGIWPVGSKVVVSHMHFAGNAYGIANNLKTTLTDVLSSPTTASR